MSAFQAYKTKTFNANQKFFVLDPNTGSPSFVQGSDLVSQLTPNSNYVYSEATRTTAQATDYAIGSLIQTGGAEASGDNLAAVYLVVAEGEGDFPMHNGNELLIVAGDDTLQERLISSDPGDGSDLVAHTGTANSVTEAINQNIADIAERVISVTSRTAMKAYDVPPGTQFSLEEGGKYVSNASGNRADHNGVTVISPTVPDEADQVGASDNEKRANYLIGTGDSAPGTPGTLDLSKQIPKPAFQTVYETATATERPREVRVKDGRLFVINQALIGASASQPTFQIFDIEKSGSPVLLSTTAIASAGDDVRAFDLQGSLAYIVTFGKGSGLNEMYIYDVSNPTSPSIVSTTNIGGGSHSIRVSGGTAFVSEYQGGALGIWDVSLPDAPYRVSQTSLGEVSVIGNQLFGDYWVTVTNTDPAKLIISDVSDITSPSVVSTLSLTGKNARHITIDGNHAYVACIGSQTLDIVDLSDTGSPSSVSSTSVPFDVGNLSWVKVSGNKCFTGGENLTVFDVSDKSAPVVEAVSKDLALSFDFWKGRAYCADYVGSKIITLQMNPSYFDAVETPEVRALRGVFDESEVVGRSSSGSVETKDAEVRNGLDVGHINIKRQSSVEADQCTQSFPSGGGLTKLIFDREVTDTLGEYDLANGDFVAARAGKYMLNCAVAVNNPPDGNTLNLVVYRGGTLYRFVGLEHAGAGESMQIQGSLIVDLEKGQSLDVRLGSDAAVSAILSTPERYSYFSIVKIQ